MGKSKEGEFRFIDTALEEKSHKMVTESTLHIAKMLHHFA
jgi:hypothetical protein